MTVDKRAAKRQAYALAAEQLREYIESPECKNVLGPNASIRDYRRLKAALRELAAEMETRYFRSLNARGF